MSTLYLWGKPLMKPIQSKNNQLSITEKVIQDPIVDISCGNDFCIFQTHEGIHVFGSNQYGQLGLKKPRHEPVDITLLRLNFNKQIFSISCGWQHALLLDSSGCVYSSGRGNQGALGYGSGDNSYEYQLVLKGAKQISAGKDHSLAICGSKTFGWGNSNEGQLGLLKKKIYFAPKELNVYPCRLIFAGAKYSLFVTSKGVFGCGQNSHCQLGLGHQNSIHLPKRLGIQDQVVKIKGGNYCIAQTNKKQHYFWGNGSFGLYKYPTKMSFLDTTIDYSVGQNFGMLKTQNNKILAWGSNRYGELAIEASEGRDYVFEVEKLTKLQLHSIRCGGNFAIGIKYHINNNINYCDDIIANQQSEAKHLETQFYHNAEVMQKMSQKANTNINNSNETKKRLYTNNTEHIHQLENIQLQKKVEKLQYQNRNLRDLVTKVSKNPSEKSWKASNNQYNQQTKFQLIDKWKVLTQQIQKSTLQEENKSLKFKFEKKRKHLNKVKQEYISLTNIIQTNMFLRNVLHMSDEKYRQKQLNLYYGEEESRDIDGFISKLHGLKLIIENAYNDS